MDVTIKCICPERGGELRHPDGDTVTLRDKLDFHSATTIRKALTLVENDDPRTRPAEILAVLSEFYVLYGVTSWTLVDDKGKPLPVSHAAIRELLFESPDIDTIIDAADDLYNAAILLPLLVRASTSSPPKPTPKPDEASSTSAPKDSTPKRPKPSKLSSTSTTQTVVTEATSLSLVGVSNGSLSSESAA
jgi:hypothetical protein